MLYFTNLLGHETLVIEYRSFANKNRIIARSTVLNKGKGKNVKNEYLKREASNLKTVGFDKTHF